MWWKNQSKGRPTFVPCQHRAVGAENGAADNKQETGTWTISCPDTGKPEKAKFPCCTALGRAKHRSDLTRLGFTDGSVVKPQLLRNTSSTNTQWEPWGQSRLVLGLKTSRSWRDWFFLVWAHQKNTFRHQNYTLFEPSLEFLELEWA